MRVDWGDAIVSVLIGASVLSVVIPVLAFVAAVVHVLGWATWLAIPFVAASYVIGHLVRRWQNRP